MKKIWLIGIGFLALSACTPQMADNLVAGALGGAMGGPVDGVAGIAAIQPQTGWEWQQTPHPDYSPTFADVDASNQALLNQQNWYSLNSNYMQTHNVGLIPPTSW